MPDLLLQALDQAVLRIGVPLRLGRVLPQPEGILLLTSLDSGKGIHILSCSGDCSLSGWAKSPAAFAVS